MAFTWIENLENPLKTGPTIVLGLFGAGATTAITLHTLLERTNTGNTIWVPIDSDHDASTTKLAIAGQAITSGDPAGFYPIIVPVAGDVFECDLAAASALAPETALYYSSATAATVTAGTNIFGYTVPGPNHPAQQKRNSQGQLGDSGVTFQSTNRARFVFRSSYSAYTLYQRS